MEGWEAPPLDQAFAHGWAGTSPSQVLMISKYTDFTTSLGSLL